MKEKKVSVIIPVYNVEKYLPQCLESVINQTLSDIEIIIVNDESPDNSDQIIKQYAKKDKRIIVINQKNSGQGNARNNGLKHATGKYISFVDSDDYIELDMLEKMYSLLEDEKADICFCSQKKVNEQNEVLEEDFIKVKGNFGTVKTNPSILFINLGPCNKLYRRTLLEKNNLTFPANKLLWYEDLPFVAKTVLCAKKICWLNDCFYNYLQRENSTMNNNNINKNTDIITSFDILNQFVNKQKKNFKHETEFWCIDHLYIYTAVRVLKIKASIKEQKQIINQLKKYLKNNFPKYKKNKYIKTLPLKRKIIYYLLNNNLYFIIKLIFSIKDKVSKK